MATSNSKPDTNQQLIGILLKRGVRCRLITNDCFTSPSILSLKLVDDKLFIYWRNKPTPIGGEIVFIQKIVRGLVHDLNGNLESSKCLSFVFPSLVVQIGFADAPTCSVLANALESLLKESMGMEKQDSKRNYFYKFRTATLEMASKEEKVHQNLLKTAYKEGVEIVGKLLHKSYDTKLKLALCRWTSYVSNINHAKMLEDRHVWRLHATSNVSKDLQAWYHALFYREVYRLPGPFWYKDATLHAYKNSYATTIDTSLTPLEEAALAHVLCSPDTTYGDVAGQMFVVQAITTIEQFQFFQKLCADGGLVIKYPRSGKATRKTFRFSFVEGNIFLTWKGKYGNQGIDMDEVTDIAPGITTEILKKRGNKECPEIYLSVICADRSIDLSFTDEVERDDWKELLSILLQKEHGILHGIKSVRPSPPNLYQRIHVDDLFEWLLLYDCIGRNCVSEDIFDQFLLNQE